MVAEIGKVISDKKLIRIAAWWLRKEYAKGKNVKDIHDDMENCGNVVIRKLYNILYGDAEKLKEKYQLNMMQELGELLVWIIYRDTAYRDPFFYVLKKAMDMKDELMPDIMKYYKEPEDWYCNVWHDTKELTKKQKEEGNLPDVPHRMSTAETYFVPKVQSARLREIDAKLKKEKIKRGW